MTEVTGSKVPFTKQNIMEKCMCGQCPVQSNSKCVRDLDKNLAAAVNKVPIQREEVGGMYCSSGKALCHDLDFHNACVCGTCAVFHEYRLAGEHPSGYFCMGGKAV
jgi:hypothetical protein